MEELGQFLQKLIARDRKYLATILLANGVEVAAKDITVELLLETYRVRGQEFLQDLATAVPQNLSFAEGYTDMEVDPSQPWLGTTRVYDSPAPEEKRNVIGYLTDLFNKWEPVVTPVIKSVTQKSTATQAPTSSAAAPPAPKGGMTTTKKIMIAGVVIVVMLVIALVIIKKLKS